MRKIIWDWILKNFGNLFSVLGVLATLYFGFLYIPDYVKESKNANRNNSSKEVIQSVKELVYSDSIVSINEISSLIRSKEVGANVKFDNSDEWFLLKAEESFMEDKFIPLNERRNLIKEIDNLIKQIPKKEKTEPVELNESISSWISDTLSILGTIFILIIGYLSFKSNYHTRKIKDEEIENELREALHETDISQESVSYQKFERTVCDILVRLNYNINQNSINKTDNKFDFEFTNSNNKYFVELKVLRASKVGLKSIESFLLQLRERQGIGIFIYNTELTPLSASRIRDFNKIEKYSKVFAFQFTTPSDVQLKIKNIVEKTA